MKRRLLATSLIIAGSCMATAEARTRSCGQVAFAPQSANGAFDIRATDVGCKTARRVAQGSRTHPDRHPGQTSRYTAAGFACRGRDNWPHGPTVAETLSFRCLRGGAVVTFERG